MATQQELQTVAKTFFDKIVLLSASYFQFRLNRHTHYESYLKYSVFVVWFSFLIFVVYFQPADKLAAAEAEANGDAEEAEDKEQKRAPKPLPVPNRQQKRLLGVCTAMNLSLIHI